MSNTFEHVDLIDIIEAYASDHGGYDSEEAVSEAFDEHVAPFVIEQYGEDDEPAMSEAFNGWTDSLCKEGVIHDEQYRLYCYVGKYA